MVRFSIIILIHTFADYFFQGEKLRRLKAFKLPYLLEHILIYSLVLFIFCPYLLHITVYQSFLYSLINGFFHFVVDFFTRIYKKVYWHVDEDKYNFVVGLDVLLHIIILMITFYLLIPDGFNAPYFID